MVQLPKTDKTNKVCTLTANVYRFLVAVFKTARVKDLSELRFSGTLKDCNCGNVSNRILSPNCDFILQKYFQFKLRFALRVKFSITFMTNPRDFQFTSFISSHSLR